MRAGIVAVAAVWGCQGPVGPAGANGMDGLPGAPGQDGADGQDGANGQDGADGQDGQDGADGQDGQDAVPSYGLHLGDGPWGLHLELVSVTGGSGPGGNVEPGDALTVAMRIEDDAGVAYDVTTLSGLSLALSGPSDHEQVVLPSFDARSQATWQADGTWAVTLAPLPSTFAPPPNDTPDLGAVDGDWGGQPLVDGTYTVGAWASLRWTWTDGETWTEASNATIDVLEGGATTAVHHEVVRQESCAACHGETLAAHGGPRTDVAVCVLCHVDGAEDRYSATDPSTTPGVSVDFTSLVHGIHMGAERPDPLVVNGYPSDPTAYGYPDYNQHAFDEVEFPAWPTGVSDCDACHGGAAQGDVESRPSAAGCTSCHSDVDVRTGLNHVGGPQADDSQCAMCHTAPQIVALHADPRDNPAVSPGLHVTVVGVHGGSGPNGALEVGDTVVVELRAEHDDGSVVDLATTSSQDVVLSGPTSHYQRILVNGAGTVARAPFDPVAGTYSYTLGVIPALVPPQANDTADLGPEVGDRVGEPLEDGTYRVSVDLALTVTDADGSYKVPASDGEDVLFGGATTIEHRSVVDGALCEQCHEEVRFHGDNRTGVDHCLTCHTAGAEDRYSSTDPTTTPGVTIDFKVLLHRIHDGSGLTQPYEVNGYGTPYTTHTYESVEFPRNDGGVARCVTCHGTSTAWKEPSTVVCTSCHDDDSTAAHAAVMTDPTFGESCAVCHGPGETFAVDTVHAWGAAH